MGGRRRSGSPLGSRVAIAALISIPGWQKEGRRFDSLASPMSELKEERMNKVNLEESLSRFDDLWRPKIIADLNDYKLVKAQ